MNIFVYVLWLVLCLSLFLFVNNFGTFLVLVLSVVVPLVSVLLAFIVSKKISVCFETAYDDQKKEKPVLNIRLKNNTVFPASYVNVGICIKNLLNGESSVQNVSANIPIKSETLLKFSPDVLHTGKIELSSDKITVSDPFGISKFKVFAQIAPCFFIVYPELFKNEILLCEEECFFDDAVKYSMEKSGSDSSETFLVREYVSGDCVKNIHFKLSQKVDKLMVRELGLPVENRILFVFDTNYVNKDCKPSPEETDVLAECLFSVCCGIVNSGNAFTLCTMKENIINCYEIACEEDIAENASELLSNTFSKNDLPFSVALKNDNFAKKYQHIVVLTFSNENDFSSIADNNRVSVLSFNSSYHADGCEFVTSFDKNNYINALGLLHI